MSDEHVMALPGVSYRGGLGWNVVTCRCGWTKRTKEFTESVAAFAVHRQTSCSEKNLPTRRTRPTRVVNPRRKVRRR